MLALIKNRYNENKIDNWFNIISPKNKKLSILKDELKELQLLSRLNISITEYYKYTFFLLFDCKTLMFDVNICLLARYKLLTIY